MYDEILILFKLFIKCVFLFLFEFVFAFLLGWAISALVGWNRIRITIKELAIMAGLSAFLGVAIMLVCSGFTTVRSASSVTSKPIVCEYWVGDPGGMDMNKVIAAKKIGWSLHGVFNIPTEGDPVCLPQSEFLYRWHHDFEEGKLTHFLDASPKTEYTCCKHQWNEYLKHGCGFNVSHYRWKKEIYKCLDKFDPKKMFVSQCRHDKVLNCNHVEQVTDVKVNPSDCKQGIPYCFQICSKNGSNFHSLCQTGRGPMLGSAEDQVAYGYTDDYIDESRDLFNCHCNGVPKMALEEWYTKSLRDMDSELDLRKVEVTTEADLVESEDPVLDVEYHDLKTNTIPSRGVTPSPNDVKCSCPGMQRDYPRRPVGRDFVRRDLHFDYYTQEEADVLEMLSWDYVIVCDIADKLGVLRPAPDRLLHYDQEWVAVIRNKVQNNIRRKRQ